MVKRIILFLVFGICFKPSFGVDIVPTISPAFFQRTDLITVTYDVTGTSLASLTDAYLWVWIPGKNINAKYNINPANSNAALTNVIGPNGPKLTKSFPAGRTVFTIQFVPANFFVASISGETSMGMLLKGNDWPNGQTSDYVVTFWDGSFQLQLNSPAQLPLFVDTNDPISIMAQSPIPANYTLLINDLPVNTASNVTTYSYTHTVTESSGFSIVKLMATSVVGALTDEVQFQYILSAASPSIPRPSGIIPGINYNSGDATRVTLCLWAPGKISVYAVGDFNDWLVTTNYLMKKDGEFFWLEITGVTAGQEYAFNYLVDEQLRVSDPYSDKVLDPDDQYISAATYPDLKPYPAKAISIRSYENRTSVFQTAQTPYAWQVNDFVKPPKEKLVVYELLLRDFFDSDHRNYQTLIDTIGYFKRLGINAIELMPIMEFNGNEGWGYNPTFMFAPDKYYGTKNKLKEFIDVCHANGIAVILDIAMNHHDVPNPYALMYFEFGADGGFGKPTANNPWFNRNPKHPYNVFFDFNHESAYTKAYLDTVTHYWLNEYRVDGYRFDLSKGFTQNTNCGGSQSNESCFGQRDNSRIAILSRMADKIWSHTPDAYVILEHFAENSEEKILAEYRYGEGMGMMIWGNTNYAYNQNTMGYASGSDVNWVYHKTRTWAVPHVVGYMESHDEDRIMYRNLTFGATAGSYNVKSETTALARTMAGGLIFYTIPGPKMMWQFAELGYDQSINLCADGTIDSDCRLSPKPPAWDYQGVYARDRLYEHTADLLRLRNAYDVFTSGDATISGGATLSKQITLKNTPYTAAPTSSDDMNVQIAVNFDVVPATINVTFPHAGIWHDYYNYGVQLNAASATVSLELQPGEFKLFTDVLIDNPIVVGVPEKDLRKVAVYPNPTTEILMIDSDSYVTRVVLHNLLGISFQPDRLSSSSWNVGQLPKGLYVAEIQTTSGMHHTKIIKN